MQIDKSGKKFAPKAPIRRAAAPSSAHDSTRASVDRQIPSQTPQPQADRQHVAASPASPTPSVSHPTPAPSQQLLTATQIPLSQEDVPTLISIPSSRRAKRDSPAPSQENRRKRTLESTHPPTDTTPTRSTSAIDQASSSVLQNNTINVTVRRSKGPATATTTTTNDSSSGAALPTPQATRTDANLPAAKRRRIEKHQNVDSSIQISTSNTSKNVPRPTIEQEHTVAKASRTARQTRNSAQPAKAIQTATTKNLKASSKARDKNRTGGAAAQVADGDTGAASGSRTNGNQSASVRKPRRSAKGKGAKSIEKAAAEIVADATQTSTIIKRRGRGRRRREPTPEESATQTITPSLVKMAELCKDIHRGKKSMREKELQEIDEAAYVLKKQKELQVIVAADAPEPTAPVNTLAETAQARLDRLSQIERVVPNTIVVDGQIVLDTTSLQIDRQALAAVERNAEQLDGVDENDLTRRVNSRSFTKSDKSGSWNEDATLKFYDGLRMFGTDFEMISKMFPGRTRRSIKLKFCKEEKLDKERIKETLSPEERIPVDIEEFSRMCNTVFDDPKELERDMEEDRKRLEEEQVQEKKAMEDAVSRRADEAAAEGAAVADDASSAKENHVEGNEQEGAAGGKTGKRGKKGGTRRSERRGKKGVAGGEAEVLGPIEEGIPQGRVEAEARLQRGDK